MEFINIHFLYRCLLFILKEGECKHNNGPRLKIFFACTIGMRTKIFNVMKVKTNRVIYEIVPVLLKSDRKFHLQFAKFLCLSTVENFDFNRYHL